MDKLTTLIAGTALSLLASQAALAEPTTFSSGEQRVTLVELYTSEGCSSCPPADRWLRDLVDDERLWDEIVPVALHVDYWDYIGWKDRFARPQYSKRQKDYVRAGAARSAYTPEFFTNGGEWAGWFRNRNLELPEDSPGTLDVSVESNQVDVSFSPVDTIDGRLEVYVAILGMGLETEVKAGENRGRRLQHDFVALHVDSKKLRESDNAHTAQIRLPGIETDAERLSIAVWITGPDGVEVLQSTGGYL